MVKLTRQPVQQCRMTWKRRLYTKVFSRLHHTYTEEMFLKLGSPTRGR